MSGLTLYMKPSSPPCRAVFLVAEALGLQLNLSFVDLQRGQNMTHQFLKVSICNTYL